MMQVPRVWIACVCLSALVTSGQSLKPTKQDEMDISIVATSELNAAADHLPGTDPGLTLSDTDGAATVLPTGK